MGSFSKKLKLKTNLNSTDTVIDIDTITEQINTILSNSYHNIEDNNPYEYCPWDTHLCTALSIESTMVNTYEFTLIIDFYNNATDEEIDISHYASKMGEMHGVRKMCNAISTNIFNAIGRVNNEGIVVNDNGKTLYINDCANLTPKDIFHVIVLGDWAVYS